MRLLYYFVIIFFVLSCEQENNLSKINNLEIDKILIENRGVKHHKFKKSITISEQEEVSNLTELLLNDSKSYVEFEGGSNSGFFDITFYKGSDIVLKVNNVYSTYYGSIVVVDNNNFYKNQKFIEEIEKITFRGLGINEVLETQLPLSDEKGKQQTNEE